MGMKFKFKIKELIGPFLLAAAFTAPQAMTYSEALREGSDWVFISAGLYAAAGICVMVMFHRMMKAPGVLLALALLSAGGWFAWQKIDTNMEKRRVHMESYARLEAAHPKMADLCRGQSISIPEAATYDPTRAGIHPTVTFRFSTYELTNRHDPYKKILYDEAINHWYPKSLDTAELVACILESERVIETCRYIGGTLSRVVTSFDVKLISLKSGQPVFEVKLEGGQPEACQETETFYGDSTTATKSGDHPSIEEAFERMRLHVETH
jgi:hypothetical protein